MIVFIDSDARIQGIPTADNKKILILLFVDTGKC